MSGMINVKETMAATEQLNEKLVIEEPKIYVHKNYNKADSIHKRRCFLLKVMGMISELDVNDASYSLIEEYNEVMSKLDRLTDLEAELYATVK